MAAGTGAGAGTVAAAGALRAKLFEESIKLQSNGTLCAFQMPWTLAGYGYGRDVLNYSSVQ